VTREPNRAKIWANSIPTAPVPTTASDRGAVSGCQIASRFVQ
jgi:hypothetical protein